MVIDIYIAKALFCWPTRFSRRPPCRAIGAKACCRTSCLARVQIRPRPQCGPPGLWQRDLTIKQFVKGKRRPVASTAPGDKPRPLALILLPGRGTPNSGLETLKLARALFKSKGMGKGGASASHVELARQHEISRHRPDVPCPARWPEGDLSRRAPLPRPGLPATASACPDGPA